MLTRKKSFFCFLTTQVVQSNPADFDDQRSVEGTEKRFENSLILNSIWSIEQSERVYQFSYYIKWVKKW